MTANNLSTIINNIRKGIIPDSLKESKGLLSYLPFKKNNILQEFEHQISKSNYARYARGLRAAIAQLQQDKTSIYDLSSEDLFEKIKNLYPLSTSSESYFLGWISTLLKEQWLKGDRHLIIRYLVFLMGYQTNNHFHYQKQLLEKLPEDFPFKTDYELEFFALTFMAICKKNKPILCFQVIDYFSQHFPNIQKAIQQDQAFLINYMEQELTIDFDGQSAKNSSLIYQLKDTLEQKRKDLNWRDFSSLDTSTLESIKEVNAMPNEAQYQFLKVLKIVQPDHNFFKNASNKIEEIVLNLVSRIEWTERLIMDYLDFCRLNEDMTSLPSTLKDALEKLQADNNISDTLFSKLWDYYIFLKLKGRKSDIVWSIIRQQKEGKTNDEKMLISWEDKLKSGFHPIPIPQRHNPYHNAHPDQIRPLFQLLNVVAKVDIIKFYQVNKLYRMRFLFEGEQYDIPTGDGFGTGCIGNLNTLLFEHKIPYQFVVLDMTYQNKLRSFSRYSHGQKLTVLTLINEENYKRFKDKIKSQQLPGFAASDQPVPPFTKNLEDLKIIYENIDLDNINLKEDPKFLAIRAELEKLQPPKQWTEILLHAMTCPLDKSPLKTWQKKATALVEKIPAASFQSGMVLIMDAMTKSNEWFLDDEKLAGLRGLTWMCRLQTNSNLLYVLQKVADKAYKKVPGGPMNAKLGNLALETINKVGTMEAYAAMGNLEAKTKYSVYKRAIRKYLKKFAGLLKEYTKEDLEDMVIPTHELKNGEKIIAVGDYQAHLKLLGLKAQVTWQHPNDKITKAVPAAIKTPFAAEIKGIKASAKSIEETLIGQSKRLEQTWLRERIWTFENWKKYYADHELMQFLVKKLIWQAKTDEATLSFMLNEKGFVNAQNEAITIPDHASVRLWHPALASVQEVLDWRTFLFDHEIKQAFKQAFREVYLLTPAEEETFDYSNRFAGHYLKGNTLYSLGKAREWKMTYEESPKRFLPNGDLVAELQITGGVLYSECTTGQLIFKDWKSSLRQYDFYRQPQKPLSEVPPVILSEVMRDVDLFVAVSTVMIDPYIGQNETGENLNRWWATSFGVKSKTAIAEVRKDLLRRLLPMTKIAKKVKIEGNYLHVEGKLKNYKINFGSGNILMSPNDQYLCIVPARNPRMEKKIWLPFEGGDSTLMVILSKAFLLAADDKITDASITRQIHR